MMEQVPPEGPFTIQEEDLKDIESRQTQRESDLRRLVGECRRLKAILLDKPPEGSKESLFKLTAEVHTFLDEYNEILSQGAGSLPFYSESQREGFVEELQVCRRAALEIIRQLGLADRLDSFHSFWIQQSYEERPYIITLLPVAKEDRQLYSYLKTLAAERNTTIAEVATTTLKQALLPPHEQKGE